MDVNRFRCLTWLPGRRGVLLFALNIPLPHFVSTMFPVIVPFFRINGLMGPCGTRPSRSKRTSEIEEESAHHPS